MPDELAEARAELKRIEARLLDLEDALDRLKDLTRVGALAAEGLHGAGCDRQASALATYFCVMADSIERIRPLNPSRDRNFGE